MCALLSQSVRKAGSQSVRKAGSQSVRKAGSQSVRKAVSQSVSWSDFSPDNHIHIESVVSQ